MPIRDTLYITDSTSCKYVVFEYFPVRKKTDLPIDSLWSSTTSVPSIPSINSSNSSNIEENILSGIIFSFLIVLIIFSRELINLFPVIYKTLFSYKNHIKLEERLGLSSQRNIVAIISVFYLPLIVMLIARKEIASNFSLFFPYFYLLSVGAIALYGLARKLLLLLMSWLTKEKNTFILIEKFSYNHIILLSLISFFTIILPLAHPGITEITMIKSLIILSLFIYLVYLIRTYQIIVAQHFSILFYILYLCAIELLPIVLLINFILSF